MSDNPSGAAQAAPRMTGVQLVSLASRHRGQQYIFGSRAKLEDPNYTGPWDCAEFVSWLAYQATGKKIGCLNGDPFSGAWAEMNPQIDLEKAYRTPGAVLVRKAKNGRAGHVAVSDGHGNTIEARSSALGVNFFIDAAKRSWDLAVLIPGVDYGT